MSQGNINKNVDYFNKSQKDETEHQNHRLSWILAAQSIFFVAFCTLISDCCLFDQTIIPLIITVGTLLSVSGIYSIIISETSIGTIYERWFDYDHFHRTDKNRPIPHSISPVPPHFLQSRMSFLMFYKFAPNVLFAAWLTALLIYIDLNTDRIDLFVPSETVVFVFILFLVLTCLIVQKLGKYHLYRWRYENHRQKLERSQRVFKSHNLRNTRQENTVPTFSKLRIYHIMVDRFNGGWTNPPQNSNNYLGGNLRGIIDKLPYILQQDCNAIMLTPIFESNSYHGYHITDYEKIDSRFGSWDDFAELVKTAHSYGMKVICDFVPNHCHRNHKFFNDAENNPNSRYKDWFFFDSSRLGGYISFQNYPDLPKFNLYNQEAADYMINVALRLVNEYKIDGLRVDHAIGVPFSFLSDLRKRVKAINPDVFVFGEVWASNIRDISQIEFRNAQRKQEFISKDPDIQDKIQKDYVGILDGVLDFTYMNLLVDAVVRRPNHFDNASLHMRIQEHFKKYPRDFQLLLFLDNHDTDRFLYHCSKKSDLDDASNYTEQFKYPYIMYYGTEQYMCNEDTVFDGASDADLRVREPMNWS